MSKPTCGDKLLEIVGDALCTDFINQGTIPEDVSPGLSALLRRRNGFYAFESALHLFPACISHQHMSLYDWNDMSKWKAVYGNLLDGYFCFAEDIFGEQFAFYRCEIVRFNPESGETTFLATTLEDWACLLLVDFEFLTGYSLAHDWQTKFGPMPAGTRLVPKLPFIFGGRYETDNLYLLDATKAMRLRADTWRQVHDLPDGARVKITVK